MWRWLVNSVFVRRSGQSLISKVNASRQINEFGRPAEACLCAASEDVGDDRSFSKHGPHGFDVLADALNYPGLGLMETTGDGVESVARLNTAKDSGPKFLALDRRQRLALA